MDIEDVEITYADGWIVVTHSDCGGILERYQLGVRLETIMLDVESDEYDEHECGNG